jgi:hypothetical protein
VVRVHPFDLHLSFDMLHTLTHASVQLHSHTFYIPHTLRKRRSQKVERAAGLKKMPLIGCMATNSKRENVN